LDVLLLKEHNADIHRNQKLLDFLESPPQSVARKDGECGALPFQRLYGILETCQYLEFYYEEALCGATKAACPI
jgi:hypothetical protein